MYQQQPNNNAYQYQPYQPQPVQGQAVYGYPQQQTQYSPPPTPAAQYQYQQQAYTPTNGAKAPLLPPNGGVDAIPVGGANVSAGGPEMAAAYSQEYMAQGVPLYAEFSHDNGGSASMNGGRKFVVQGYKDIWAAIFFLLLAAGIIGVGSYNFKHSLSDITINDNGHGTLTMAARWVGIGVGAGAGMTIVSLAIFYFLPKASIILANLLCAGIFVAIGVLFIRQEQLYAGIVFMLVGALRLLILYIYRKLIPLSALLLKQSAVLSKRHPMMTIIAFTTIAVATGFTALTFATAFPTIKPWLNGYDITGPMIAMIFFMAFAIYWSSQVFFNVGHTTFCGLVSTWYFCGQDTMPSNPTLHSAKRALTTSFGSVCFGSLVVAIIRTIRFILRSLAGNRNNFCACIALCLLSCIEGIVQMFNHYAFVYVSMYGCGYVDGARKTMALIKTSPYMPLFNNLLIDGVLTMFSLIIPASMGVIAYYSEKAREKNESINNSYDWGKCMIMAVSAAVACLITITQSFRVVDSTTTALLVCLSEEPRLIFSSNVEFAHELAEIVGIANTCAELDGQTNNGNNGATQRSMNTV